MLGSVHTVEEPLGAGGPALSRVRAPRRCRRSSRGGSSSASPLQSPARVQRDRWWKSPHVAAAVEVVRAHVVGLEVGPDVEGGSPVAPLVVRASLRQVVDHSHRTPPVRRYSASDSVPSASRPLGSGGSATGHWVQCHPISIGGDAQFRSMRAGAHRVNYLRYWVDEAGKIFCLVERVRPRTSRRTCTARRTVWSPKRSTRSPKGATDMTVDHDTSRRARGVCAARGVGRDRCRVRRTRRAGRAVALGRGASPGRPDSRRRVPRRRRGSGRSGAGRRTSGCHGAGDRLGAADGGPVRVAERARRVSPTRRRG